MMQTIVAYLGRKTKFKLSTINKDFRDLIVPRTLITIGFNGKESIMSSTLFQSCVFKCKKVEKLYIEEITLDLETVNVI